MSSTVDHNGIVSLSNRHKHVSINPLFGPIYESVFLDQVVIDGTGTLVYTADLDPSFSRQHISY